MNPEQSACIIGGGLGGIATAIRLAASGFRVTLLEQGVRIGGKMNRWEKDRFVFDTGPSLITLPHIFEDLFECAGSKLSNHLELIPMHPLTEYIYPDGTRFSYTTDLPAWLETLKAFESRDISGFYKFQELGGRIYELSRSTFFTRIPTDPPDLSILRSLRRFPIRYGWGNYHKTVAEHFRSPHLQQLYDRYPTYVGSSPYQSPATFAVIPYIEYAFGGWYPSGGLYTIVSAYTELAESLGVTLRTDTLVSRIEHTDRRVNAVILDDGERIATDVVVMNGDASHTPGLLGEETPQLKEEKRSMSGFVMLLGISRTLHEHQHHTVFFSHDYESEFDQLFEDRRFPEDPTVYVNIPSRSDRSVVPGEGETIFIMANAPANDEPWSDEQTATARDRVMQRLRSGGFPDVENDIVVSDIWTPTRIGSTYRMPGGAIYGTHSHGWREAFMRPPNKDRRYEGLYYVGGSTHPGGGTPTVLMSAKITSDLVQRYES